MKTLLEIMSKIRKQNRVSFTHGDKHCVNCDERLIVHHTNEYCRDDYKRNKICNIEGCSRVYCKNSECLGGHMTPWEEFALNEPVSEENKLGGGKIFEFVFSSICSKNNHTRLFVHQKFLN